MGFIVYSKKRNIMSTNILSGVLVLAAIILTLSYGLSSFTTILWIALCIAVFLIWNPEGYV